MPDLLSIGSIDIGSMRVEPSPIILRHEIFAVLQKAVAIAQRKQLEEFVSQIEDELRSLYQMQDFDAALKQLRSDVKLGGVTRSEKGCVVASAEGGISLPPFPIQKLVDTTGAGDLFAAGFLFGLVRGAGYEKAGMLGGLAAAEVIQRIGARPQTSLKELAQKNGLQCRSISRERSLSRHARA
jgi:sugar/nucleoside kinase (ribokinase family)